MEDRDTVTRALYQALLEEDTARRAQIKTSINEFVSGASEDIGEPLSEPSINVIFTEALIQALNERTDSIKKESQEALNEISNTVDALQDVTASIKFKRRDNYKLPTETLKATAAAAQEITDLTAELKRVNA